MDLAQLLKNCASSYFDPDLFRMNTNQFLQTARTVTFIIQKNKDRIPNFNNWYEANVISEWKDDELMQWAKDSRNLIEKEGDLELYSSLQLSLLFSYLEEQDVVIDCGRNELLNAGVKKLVRIARSKLPSGVSDAAIIKIERRWVTATLPAWELLHALGYVYVRIFNCCKILADHLSEPIEKQIPKASSIHESREHARKVGYVKLRGLDLHHIRSENIMIEPGFAPPENLHAVLVDMQKQTHRPVNLHETLQQYAQLAQTIFEHYGYHVPILFLFDREWHVVDVVSTQFNDQADKFIFWRSMNKRGRIHYSSGLDFLWPAAFPLSQSDRKCLLDFMPEPVIAGWQAGIDAIADAFYV